MSTTTNANKTGAAATESTEVAEVTPATEVTSGVTDIIGGPASPSKPPKSPKRRMAREPQGGAGAAESKGDGATSPAPRATSKIASVIALLECPEGATLAEMVEATGWLPHTTRAALTGIKKKGNTITKGKRGEVTCYRSAKAG